jgi:hypothetical protein
MGFYDGPSIVTNGLVLSLDAADKNSYPGSGTAWKDIGGLNNTVSNLGSSGVTFGSTESITYADYTANTAGSDVITFAYTEVGATLNNYLASSSFTIDIWMSRNTSIRALGTRESVFSNAGAASGFRFQLGASNLYYLLGGSNQAGYSEGNLGSGYLTYDGRWNHVVIVYDRLAQLGSYAVSGYANGNFQSSTAVSSSVSSSFLGSFSVQNPGVSIGCCSSFKGRISKISVYNRALNSTEIAQNYNAQKSRFGL